MKQNHHMLIHPCSEINHLYNSFPAKQPQPYNGNHTANDIWREFLAGTNKPNLFKFVTITSCYTELLSMIQHNTELPMPVPISKHKP